MRSTGWRASRRPIATVTQELAIGSDRCLTTTSTATMVFPRAVCDALDALARSPPSATAAL
jgi:hypothetical protein